MCNHTHVVAESVCWKTEVSANELHRTIDSMRDELLQVYSANFCARNPPREAPNRWTWNGTKNKHWHLLKMEWSFQWQWKWWAGNCSSTLSAVKCLNTGEDVPHWLLYTGQQHVNECIKPYPAVDGPAVFWILHTTPSGSSRLGIPAKGHKQAFINN